MIKLKTAADLGLLRQGGRRLAAILQALAAEVRPGVTPRQLDQIARDLIQAGGDQAAFLNYQPDGAPGPYPAALCVSVNEVVVHGIPGDQPLRAGDIVSLDLGLRHGGLFTDSALTVPVGEVKPELSALLETTRVALQAGVAKARVGNRLGDIGAAIQALAKPHGYGVVRELGGHGVGFKVHEEPLVPNFGKAGTGLRLQAGLVLAIEPMFNLGGAAVEFADDGYTVTTADGLPSAHFEHTVAILDSGPEVLTVL